jgi:O-antigen ligase
MDKLVFVLLCGLVFVIPWEMIGALGELPSLSRLLGLITILTAVVAMFARPTLRRVPWAMRFMILFWIWTALGLLWSVDPPYTQIHVVTILLLVLFVWLIWQFCPSVDRQVVLKKTYIWGHVVPLAWMYVDFARAGFSRAALGARFTGAGHDANYMAELLNVVVLFVVYLLARGRGRRMPLRPFYVGLLPAAAIAVFLTGSRTGVLGLAASGVVSLFILRYGGFQTKFLVLLALAGIVLGIVTLVPAELLTRVTTETSLKAGTFQERLDSWQAGLAAWLRVPIQGIGGGTYASLTAGTFAGRMVAHNVFISELVEKGIVGFILFMTFLMMIVKSAWSMPKLERYLWLGSLGVWGLASLTASSGHDKLTWFLFGIVLAQAAALGRAANPYWSPGNFPATALAARRRNFRGSP